MQFESPSALPPIKLKCYNLPPPFAIVCSIRIFDTHRFYSKAQLSQIISSKTKFVTLSFLGNVYPGYVFFFKKKIHKDFLPKIA